MGETHSPWPNKNDNAFKKGLYGPTQANLDWLDYHCSVCDKDSIISQGFKEAADKIVDNLKTGKKLGHPDKFFFPVVYLYRHAFELCLKCIIRNGVDRGIITKSKQVEDILNKTHSLHILWNKARYVLEEHWPDGNTETLTSVEKTISRFHKVDPSGQTVRYAKDRKGNPNLADGPNLVDLVNLKKVASNLYRFLHSCILGLEKECGRNQ